MKRVKSVLALGAGLGSVVSVICRSGLSPRFTLVELDEVVLDLAMQIHGTVGERTIIPVCKDAGLFMEGNTGKFDLVFVDVFIGKLVPDFVRSKDFLEHCHRALSDIGLVCVNYIVEDLGEWEQFQVEFRKVFLDVNVLVFETNRLLVGKPRGNA